MSSVMDNAYLTYLVDAGIPWQYDLPPECYSVLQEKTVVYDKEQIARELYQRTQLHSCGKNSCGLCVFPMVPVTIDGCTTYRPSDIPNIPDKLRSGGKPPRDHIYEACMKIISLDDTEQFLETLVSLTDGELQTSSTREEQVAFKDWVCKKYAANPIENRKKEAYFQIGWRDIIELCNSMERRPDFNPDVMEYMSKIFLIKEQKGTPPIQEILMDMEKIDISEDTSDVIKRLTDINNDDLFSKVKKHISKCMDYIEKKISIDGPKNEDFKVSEPSLEKWFAQTRGIELPTFAHSSPEPEDTTVSDDEPSAFLCPIGRDIMSDPVVAEDNQTYDRVNIETWFKKKHTSPLSNVTIGVSLRENIVLRCLIEDWKDKNGIK